ncbi:cytochrome P460 family protein [endosymbiont of unidentified scaly snail isolate Monju]|uniref:cytochrome P460 family protein n=1 Tax=endosymbiont of unidentified scaly snail isolate Monju TaxID=1248727 RepID=UPI0003892285|nr:cytochrome P460 family protein [endosymbiont of unidentified scaly snail isolate Monju]BAN69043.1 conserved hypothetical protein [endosymbiont of unidentified scaly snail isolate Monju]
MKHIRSSLLALVAVSLVTAACAGPYGSTGRSSQASGAPFGTVEDLHYAQVLWQHLRQRRLVGENAIHGTPYTGTHPHGAILDTLGVVIRVGHDTGPVIVKRNYGGKGVSKATVANTPERYLKAVTVMFKRPGYDPANRDWFWVKYAPDGSVLKNPKGMALAGRVAKGSAKGCIACHRTAPGSDLVFNHDRYAR